MGPSPMRTHLARLCLLLLLTPALLVACSSAPEASANASHSGSDSSVSEPDGSAPEADAGPATLGVMSVDELWDALQDGGTKDFLLIDVHVPHHGNIPRTDAELTYLDIDALAAYLGPDLDRKAVLYCLANPMSMSAGDQLVARGYRALRYLDGGMSAWTAAGHKLDP